MHVPVLAETAIAWLDVRGGGKYVDCTAGAGGHAVLIATGVGPRGHVLAIDRDLAAVELAKANLREFPWVRVVHGNYADIATILADRGMAKVDGVLIDAGMSSIQLDDAARGFTFQSDGPLDMRMDSSQGPSAAQFLTAISEPDLARMLDEYGDVRHARRIAKSICSRRDSGRLETTADLTAAVLESTRRVNAPETGASRVPRTGPRADAVRQVFQAIRIAVNDELGSLERGLRAAVDVLTPGGRLVLISFQSGEDRVWKRVMNDLSRANDKLAADGRVIRTIPPITRVLTKRAVGPTAEEIHANPRAHSARLRAAERLNMEN